MTILRIGTAEGLIEPPHGRIVEGPTRVFGDAALCADGRILWKTADGWTALGRAPDLLCAVDAPGGLLIGTEGAHLIRVAPTGLERVEAFEDAEGRDAWYTPWGGPPETRSLARTDDNVLLASIHVGGIPRSDDGGRTWRMSADGLHASYCRAVAVTADAVILSASEGPRGRTSALYRRGLNATGPFERITDWIDGNVDTHALDARDDQVVYGTRTGTVWQSLDAGTTWDRLFDDLAPVTSLSLVP
jgi:photosystem II stability/assembly factor-like uncharacterized protein